MKHDYNYFENAPGNFGLCFKNECASAADCLRALAARDASAVPDQLIVANPLQVDAAGKGNCPHFKSAETVRIAYGFINALGTVPGKHQKDVRKAILAHFCLRNYYHLRRGDKPMYPETQQLIASILTDHGAPSPVEFDRYEDSVNWE